MEKQRISKYTIIIGIITILAVMGASFAGSFVYSAIMNQDAQAASVAQLEDSDVIVAYEQALTQIYENSLDSVVNIQVTQQLDQQEGIWGDTPFHFGPPDGEGMPDQMPREFFRGQGSGFVWDTEGHIVTNYHVVAEATEIDVTFANGDMVEAELLGSDPDADLAIIKVDVPADQLQPLPVGNSDDLQVGHLLIAIGNPFGQDFTMTTGIVSAVGRTVRSGNSPFSIPEVIQTDAAINPGNSGGPLLNRKGEVVGINTMILSRTGSNAGVGFAVPVNIAQQIIPTLIEGEDYEYAWLGITGQTMTSELTEFMDLTSDVKGVLVIGVNQESPADEAGLQGSDRVLEENGEEFRIGGDVIIAINEITIESMDDLITYLLEETRPGDEITLTLLRSDGNEETVDVTLQARPQSN